MELGIYLAFCVLKSFVGYLPFLFLFLNSPTYLVSLGQFFILFLLVVVVYVWLVVPGYYRVLHLFIHSTSSLTGCAFF